MSTSVTCRCGKVALILSEQPFLTATCYCQSCQAGAEALAALPLSRPMVDDLGGTAFRLYRKDHVRISGHEYLAGHRLTPQSGTRRVVATCCGAPMFLELRGGHWLSLYNASFPDAETFVPQVLTQIKPAKGPLPDVPHGGLVTARFMARLAAEWAKMRFKTPKLPEIRDLVL